ncbi:MAG: polyribonucleotide nucleotidyltransferase [bacterium]|nr:polyribonucleotide nucleotidyltransferase [bacterium]
MPFKQWRALLAGRELIVERGRMAWQANGAVTVTYGATTVLATAVMGKKPREGIDFFPLTVEFEEKLYAAGKIKGSRFIKREGRPTDEAVLSGRLIDRTLRPLFDGRMRNEVQVVVTVLSIDGENDPDTLGIIAASLALATSDIPWNGPVGAVRVGMEGASFIANPSYALRKETLVDVVVSGTKDRINMIEAGAREVGEEKMIEAITFAEEEIRRLIAFQESIIAEIKPIKATVLMTNPDADVIAFVKKQVEGKLEEAVYQPIKSVMSQKLSALEDALKTAVSEHWPDDDTKTREALAVLEEEVNAVVHKNVLTKGRRPDGRKLDEVRALSCEVGVLARTHGSALFSRGDTQALGTVTLAGPGAEQVLDTIEYPQEGKKRFMLHYFFPPYSVGEVKPMRGPGRREIGHGALAERAIEPLLPPKDVFPYTIRVVSDILSSNGSSSQASITAASLALMDGGVPIKAPAAGIAMGLMTGDGGAYKILTDIQGPEDHHGDMDFKVAGTKTGITALQMDVKIDGVTVQMLQEGLAQAREARLQILAKMQEVIAEPRKELSPFAPRITTLHINPEKIGDLIGPGGKVINKIIEETGVQIDIEDDGSVFITAVDQKAAERAIELVTQITRDVKVGELFEQARITRLMEFGAFAEVLPKQEGLIHISEMAPWRVGKVEDVVKVGDIVPVYVKEIDQLGRINLSLKIARNMLGLEQPKAPEGYNPDAGFDAPRRAGGHRGGPHGR